MLLRLLLAHGECPLSMSSTALLSVSLLFLDRTKLLCISSRWPMAEVKVRISHLAAGIQLLEPSEPSAGVRALSGQTQVLDRGIFLFFFKGLLIFVSHLILAKRPRKGCLQREGKTEVFLPNAWDAQR